MSHGECGDTFLWRVVSGWGHSTECMWWPHLHPASGPWLWPHSHHTQQLPGVPFCHSRPHTGKCFTSDLYGIQNNIYWQWFVRSHAQNIDCSHVAAECKAAPGARGGGCWWRGLQDPSQDPQAIQAEVCVLHPLHSITVQRKGARWVGFGGGLLLFKHTPLIIWCDALMHT